MNSLEQDNSNFSIGKFLISPLVKQTPTGDFSASVSIRSGRGSGTHDRVMRFVPSFATREGALHYAAVQGRSWLLGQAHSPIPSLSLQ
jgi:hypothetical protein